ncbi:MAG: HAD family hydrolase [Rhizobiales bacterium]|nr:HAD family hydrolase [Hyphomicrobiales bacterium]
MHIRGILFDKDGVFVDFDKTWAPALKVVAGEIAGGDAALAAHYLTIAGYDRDADMFMPGSVWAAGNTIDLVEVWLPDGDAAARAAMAQQVDGYCAQCEPVPVLPIKRLQEVFGALRAAGYQLAVATNDSSISARRTVERFGLTEHFDLVMGYDSVANPKPAADPILKFAADHGLNVDELAMVGDNLHDAEMARAAGVRLAIGVLSGNATRKELTGQVDHILNDITEVEGLLASLRL